MSAPSVIAQFRAGMKELASVHRPSRLNFFTQLPRVSREVIAAPEVLGELYTRYQAGMHATRVMVYHLPHLDSPALRARKLQIFVDDDALPGGDTHHHQLARAFASLGAAFPLREEEFGELSALARQVDPRTAALIEQVVVLYPRSLGAWCVVEAVSSDWMTSLASGLAVHFPAITQQAYFADCFAQGVEERHAQEAAEVTELVLERRPELLKETLLDASRMARALDSFWGGLSDFLEEASAKRKPQARAATAR